MRHEALFLSACTDGATFHSRGNQSWSPYTATCFNLPPWLRNKFGCVLLFGVMPNKIRNYARTRTHSRIELVRDIVPPLRVISTTTRRTHRRPGESYLGILRGVPVGGPTSRSRPPSLQRIHRGVLSTMDSNHPPNRRQCWVGETHMQPQTASVHRCTHPRNLHSCGSLCYSNRNNIYYVLCVTKLYQACY